MSTAVQPKSLHVSGTGLVTGLPVTVTIEQAPMGHGIVFNLDGELPIPARLEAVVNTQRGVTLGHPSGKFLSIVEHFLCACSLAGLPDLRVNISGAPELPILDGSSAVWFEKLTEAFGRQSVASDIPLREAVFYRHSEEVCLYAIPADHFQITYAVDFPHPDLASRWVRWDSREDGVDVVTPARTFGLVRDLPVLLSQGLAKGVSLENTLGLNDDGSYTTPLRMEDEPVRHKLIDLMGDLTLMGFNPLRLKAHVFAFNAGHDSHTRFAGKLLKVLAAEV